MWHYTDIVGILLNYLWKFWNTHYDLLKDTKIISVNFAMTCRNSEINVTPLEEEGRLARHSCRFGFVCILKLKLPVPVSLYHFVNEVYAFPSSTHLLLPTFPQCVNVVFLPVWPLFIFIFILLFSTPLLVLILILSCFSVTLSSFQ